MTELTTSAVITERTKTAEAMTFSSDDDALEFLRRYGHEESQNGVIRGDWRSFDADCRAAVGYLCDEWDFVFKHTAATNRRAQPRKRREV